MTSTSTKHHESLYLPSFWSRGVMVGEEMSDEEVKNKFQKVEKSS
jgi:hypothetical protein